MPAPRSGTRRAKKPGTIHMHQQSSDEPARECLGHDACAAGDDGHGAGAKLAAPPAHSGRAVHRRRAERCRLRRQSASPAWFDRRATSIICAIEQWPAARMSEILIYRFLRPLIMAVIIDGEDAFGGE